MLHIVLYLSVNQNVTLYKYVDNIGLDGYIFRNELGTSSIYVYTC